MPKVKLVFQYRAANDNQPRSWLWVAFLAVLVVAPAASNSWAGARALDGDDLILDGQDYRIMAVDAPESGQVCKDGNGVDYDCGAMAKAALDSILAGQIVTCVPIKRDGTRAIANCSVGDLDAATALIRSGWGLVRPDFIANSATASTLCAVEAEARNAKRGLWAGTFELPYFVKGGRKKTREQISCRTSIATP